MFTVTEYFVSINGEGMRAGEPSVFIRFRGVEGNIPEPVKVRPDI